MVDVLVIGAGPIGLCCALHAQRAGFSARVVERGALVDSLLGYPTNMEFFSTPEGLEIGGYPLTARGYKPIREEAIEYYRRVAEAERLDIRLYEAVEDIEGTEGAFTVRTSRGTHAAAHVVVATGFYGVQNPLGVPGEDLPKVTHYYKEPYPYSMQRVAIVGAKNSAAKAALECVRQGAEVTLIHRGPELSTSIKYWIRPDLENRIKEGRIRAFFDTTVAAIHPHTLDLQTPGGPVTIENDWVLAMTGYRPDFALLESLGLECSGPARRPVHDRDTRETSRPGVYLAGTVCGGLATSEWFIENGRDHARQIVADLERKRAEVPV